jgi:hypothetical protein
MAQRKEVSQMSGRTFWFPVVSGIAFASILLDVCARQVPPGLPVALAASRAIKDTKKSTRTKSTKTAPKPTAAPKPVAPTAPAPRRDLGLDKGGDHRQTGLGWLLDNQLEPSGYGLYSYLLFGSRPSEATRPLYIAVVKASLTKVERIEKEILYFHPAQLNLYLVPLIGKAPGDVQLDSLANLIVDNYNYPRASKILASLPGQRTHVYILSVLSKPIDPSHMVQPPYLWQDLSNVEPSIVVAWMQYFLDQSAKDRPWEESMGDKLALDLRNNIERAAIQLRATIPAMAEAVKWVRP